MKNEELNELVALSEQIRDETAPGRNTALRVGTLFLRIIKSLNSVDLDAMAKYFLSKIKDDVTPYNLTAGDLMVKKGLEKETEDGDIELSSGNLSVEGTTKTDVVDSCNNDNIRVLKNIKAQRGLDADEINALNDDKLRVCINIEITKDGAIRHKEFVPDIVTGQKWQIDENGDAEMESLVLRSFLAVPEYRFNRITVESGARFGGSAAGVVLRTGVDEAGDKYFDLKLEEGEVGSFLEGDISSGIWHFTGEKSIYNATNEDVRNAESNPNINSGLTFAGFGKVEFVVTRVDSYELDGVIYYNGRVFYNLSEESASRGLSPQPSMAVIGYGTDKPDVYPNRTKAVYETKSFVRFLYNMNGGILEDVVVNKELQKTLGGTIGQYVYLDENGEYTLTDTGKKATRKYKNSMWDIAFQQNVACHLGDSTNIRVTETDGTVVELDDYSAYLSNVYIRGTIRDLDIRDLTDKEGLLSKAYIVDLTSSVNTIACKNVTKDDGTIGKEYDLKDEAGNYKAYTSVALRCNTVPMTLAPSGTAAEEGQYTMSVVPTYCTCKVENATIYITDITEEALENDMCFVTISITPYGEDIAIEKVFVLRLVYDGNDGGDIEFVFFRQKEQLPVPTIYEGEENGEDTQFFQKEEFYPYLTKEDAEKGTEAHRWYDDSKGIDDDFWFEYSAKRLKKNGIWQPFSAPSLWVRRPQDGVALVYQMEASANTVSLNEKGELKNGDWFLRVIKNSTSIQPLDTIEKVTAEGLRIYYGYGITSTESGINVNIQGFELTTLRPDIKSLLRNNVAYFYLYEDMGDQFNYTKASPISVVQVVAVLDGRNSSSVLADLQNDIINVGCNFDGSLVEDYESENGIYASSGNGTVQILDIEVDASGIVKNQLESGSTYSKDFIYVVPSVSADKTKGKVDVRIKKDTIIPLATEIPIQVTIKEEGKSEEIRYCSLKVNSVRPGKNGESPVIYELIPSVDIVKKSPEGSVLPDKDLEIFVSRTKGTERGHANNSEVRIVVKVDNVNTSTEFDSTGPCWKLPYNNFKNMADSIEIDLLAKNGDTTEYITVDHESIKLVEDGADGIGQEQVFFRKNEEVAPVLDQTAYSGDNGDPTKDEFLPRTNSVAWTDDPQGVDKDHRFEYTAIRVKRNGAWNAFGTPALWSRYSLDGEIMYVVDIDNEMSSIPVDSEGKLERQRVIAFGIGAFRGTKNITNECTYNGLEGGDINGYNVNVDLPSGTVTITVSPLATAMPEVTDIKMQISHPTYGTRIVTHTIATIKTGGVGDDAELYEINPSVNQIIFSRNEDNTLSPSSITFTSQVKHVKGENSEIIDIPTGYKFLFSYTKDNPSAPATSNASFTVSATDTESHSYLYAFLFDPSGKLIDRESIPILKDGKKGDEGDAGQSVFVSRMFKRGSKPTETPKGKSGDANFIGSYEEPNPTGNGWSDGIPEGEGAVWESHRCFTSDGKAPQDSAWSEPTLVADSDTQDVCFSADEVCPTSSLPAQGTNTENTHWHNTPNPNDIWQAISYKKLGVWSEWNVTKIRGEKGDNAQYAVLKPSSINIQCSADMKPIESGSQTIEFDIQNKLGTPEITNKSLPTGITYDSASKTLSWDSNTAIESDNAVFEVKDNGGTNAVLSAYVAIHAIPQGNPSAVFSILSDTDYIVKSQPDENGDFTLSPDNIKVTLLKSEGNDKTPLTTSVYSLTYSKDGGSETPLTITNAAQGASVATSGVVNYITFRLYEGDIVIATKSVSVMAEGGEGKDGESIEFVYYRKNTESTPGLYANRNDYNGKSATEDDYIPWQTLSGTTDHWTDTPTGVDANHKFEYYALRKKKDKTWGEFQGPWLWNRYSVDGNDSIVADLSNEMSSIGCTKDGFALYNKTLTTKVNLYKGSSHIDFKVSASSNNSGVKVSETAVSTGGVNSATTRTGELSLNIFVAKDADLSSGAEIIFTVTKADDSTIVRQCSFVINGVRAGEKGDAPTVYELSPSVNCITKNESGSITNFNGDISIKVVKTTGAEPPTYATNADVTVRVYVNGSTTALSSTWFGYNSSTKTWGIDRAAFYNATSLEITLTLNGSTDVIDKENIPIVSDGQTGGPGTAYTVSASPNKIVIDCNDNGKAYAGGSSIISFNVVRNDESTIAINSLTSTNITVPTGMGVTKSVYGTGSKQVKLTWTEGATINSGSVVVNVTADNITFPVTIAVEANRQGSKGDIGQATAMPRDRGWFNPLLTYYKNELFFDYVRPVGYKTPYILGDIKEWPGTDNKYASYYPTNESRSEIVASDGVVVWRRTSYQAIPITTSAVFADASHIGEANIGEAFIGNGMNGVTTDQYGNIILDTVNYSPCGWLINGGSIRHTLTGLELTRDGKFYMPAGSLNFKVGTQTYNDIGNAIADSKVNPNLIPHPYFDNANDYISSDRLGSGSGYSRDMLVGPNGLDSANAVSPYCVVLYGHNTGDTTSDGDLYTKDMIKQMCGKRIFLKPNTKYTFTILVSYSGSGGMTTSTHYFLYNDNESTNFGSNHQSVPFSTLRMAKYKELSITFTTGTSALYFDYRLGVNFAKGVSTDNYTVFNAVKLEEGDRFTGWCDNNDVSNLLNKLVNEQQRQLLETGIDISSRNILVTADNFMIQNNWGIKSLYLNGNGDLVLGGYLTPHIARITTRADYDKMFYPIYRTIFTSIFNDLGINGSDVKGNVTNYVGGSRTVQGYPIIIPENTNIQTVVTAQTDKNRFHLYPYNGQELTASHVMMDLAMAEGIVNFEIGSTQPNVIYLPFVAIDNENGSEQNKIDLGYQSTNGFREGLSVRLAPSGQKWDARKLCSDGETRHFSDVEAVNLYHGSGTANIVKKYNGGNASDKCIPPQYSLYFAVRFRDASGALCYTSVMEYRNTSKTNALFLSNSANCNVRWQTVNKSGSVTNIGNASSITGTQKSISLGSQSNPLTAMCNVNFYVGASVASATTNVFANNMNGGQYIPVASYGCANIRAFRTITTYGGEGKHYVRYEEMVNSIGRRMIFINNTNQDVYIVCADFLSGSKYNDNLGNNIELAVVRMVPNTALGFTCVSEIDSVVSTVGTLENGYPIIYYKPDNFTTSTIKYDSLNGEQFGGEVFL